MRSKLGILSLFVCCALLLALVSPICLGEEMYLITGSELQQLNEIQKQYETLLLNYELKMNSLNLITSDKQKIINELLIDSELLRADLESWKKRNADNERLLIQQSETISYLESKIESLEKSLKELLREAQSEIRRLKRENFILKVILGIVTGYALSK